MHSSDQWIYGKGECGIYARGTFWRQYRIGSDTAFCGIPAGVQFIVHAMCGCGCFDQAGAWR